jgi:hypothetical protein
LTTRSTISSAGLDWAKDEHALCILDEVGRKLFEGRFAHDERGIGELCRSLAAHDVQAVAIERPEGVLVESLLAAPACWCWRSTPTSSRPPAHASGPPVANRMASTRSAWLRAGQDRPSPLRGTGSRFGRDQGAKGLLRINFPICAPTR